MQRPQPSTKVVDFEVEFLADCVANETSVTVYLINGTKLQGRVTAFSDFAFLLTRDGRSQLVYKHAVSTVSPYEPK